MIGGFIKELNLDERTRGFFLTAMNMMFQNQRIIQNEITKKQLEEAKNR